MTFCLSVLPETAWVPCATAVDKPFNIGTRGHVRALFSPQHSHSAESTRLSTAHSIHMVETARSSEKSTKHEAMSPGSANYSAVQCQVGFPAGEMVLTYLSGLL